MATIWILNLKTSSSLTLRFDFSLFTNTHSSRINVRDPSCRFLLLFIQLKHQGGPLIKLHRKPFIWADCFCVGFNKPCMRPAESSLPIQVLTRPAHQHTCDALQSTETFPLCTFSLCPPKISQLKWWRIINQQLTEQSGKSSGVKGPCATVDHQRVSDTSKT